jgi:hypothetical protein
MKRVLIAIGVTLSIFFQACNAKTPTRDDVIGVWISSDNAVLVLNKDGTFTGDSIPTRFGFIAIDSITQRKFSGSGNWTFRKGQAQWEVYLDFNQATVGKNGCAFPVLIAGENGILENNPPWYLFLWQEEEGGQRYEFKRK